MMKKRKVSKGTIIRTIVLIVALINSALVLVGFEPLPWTGEAVGEFVSAVFMALASAAAWWKNNSVTQPALHADSILKAVKDGDAAINEVAKG